MSKQEISSLAVKLLALYFIVQTVIDSSFRTASYLEQQFYNSMQGVTPNFGMGSFPSLGFNDLITIIFPVLIAFLLWRFADKIAVRMVGKTSEQKTKTSLTALEIQAMIISAVGLVLIAFAVPQFILFFTFIAAPAAPDADFNTIWLSLINPALYIILAVILITRANNFAELLQRKK